MTIIVMIIVFIVGVYVGAAFASMMAVSGSISRQEERANDAR